MDNSFIWVHKEIDELDDGKILMNNKISYMIIDMDFVRLRYIMTLLVHWSTFYIMYIVSTKVSSLEGVYNVFSVMISQGLHKCNDEVENKDTGEI